MLFSPRIERSVVRNAIKKTTNPTRKFVEHSTRPIHSSLEDTFDYTPFLEPTINTTLERKSGETSKLFLNAHIGEAEVCMSVDTTAGQCQMSTAVMDYLGLRDQMEDTFDIVDSGNTLGEIADVFVSVDNFRMKLTFLVTDRPDNFVVIGINELRNYDCIIDLPSNHIKFGGQNGTAVQFMKESDIRKVQSHLDLKTLEFGFKRACA
jgi:hypothetical protein